jgi:hypothetical protein
MIDLSPDHADTLLFGTLMWLKGVAEPHGCTG